MVLANPNHKSGWPGPYIHTVYDHIFGDFPAKNSVYTPYIPINVWFWPTLIISRVGQNRIYAPYMTVYLVIFLPKTPCIHHTVYAINVWFWPTLIISHSHKPYF